MRLYIFGSSTPTVSLPYFMDTKGSPQHVGNPFQHNWLVVKLCISHLPCPINIGM